MRRSAFPIGFYAVSERLTEVARRIEDQHPATDGELVAALLAFANATPAELASFTDAAVASASRVDAALSALSGNPQTIMADYTRTTAPTVHAWVREELAKIASGRGTFIRLDSARPTVTADTAVEGPVIFERITGSVRSAQIERRHVFGSLEAYAQWSVLLVRRLGADICRCRLPSCGVFFLAESTKGRTRRKYCTPDHLEEAGKLTGSERVMASRAGLSLADFRKQRKHK